MGEGDRCNFMGGKEGTCYECTEEEMQNPDVYCASMSEDDGPSDEQYLWCKPSEGGDKPGNGGKGGKPPMPPKVKACKHLDENVRCDYDGKVGRCALTDKTMWCELFES